MKSQGKGWFVYTWCQADSTILWRTNPQCDQSTQIYNYVSQHSSFNRKSIVGFIFWLQATTNNFHNLYSVWVFYFGILDCESNKYQIKLYTFCTMTIKNNELTKSVSCFAYNPYKFIVCQAFPNMTYQYEPRRKWGWFVNLISSIWMHFHA